MAWFVLLNAITHITALGVIYLGTQLIMHGHGFAGGCIVFGGLIALIFGGYDFRRKP